MNFTVKNKYNLEVTQATFPGGEVLIKVDADNLKFWYDESPITITARIHNSNDLFGLALLKDAIENCQFRDNKQPINLCMPYVPYARQDRACIVGEPNSIKVLANFINNLKFNAVEIFDPHSDVTPALLDNLTVYDQHFIIRHNLAFCNRVADGGVFVSPDAGANKKTMKIAQFFEHNKFIRADKLRNLATGDILETVVYEDNLDGMTAFIVDDICDGGRTFIELAKVLKAKGAAKVILYVTHGIFSKGSGCLYSGGIDEIYTTNTYQEMVSSDTFNVLDINELR